jgi:DUF3102 family protein
MTAIKQPATEPEIILAQNADAIRVLGKRVIGDIIEIGRLLTEAKQIAGHGNWLPWLEREFGWTDRTAENFINVHKLAAKSENFSDLSLPVSGLYMLAAPGTPEEVREAVMERAQSGERLSVKDVRKQIDEAREKHAPETADRPSIRKPAAKKHPPAMRSRTEAPVKAMTAEQAVCKLRDQIDAAVATAIGVSPMQPIIDAIFDIAAARAEGNGSVKMFVQRVRQRIDAMELKVDQGWDAGYAPKIDLRPVPAAPSAPAMATVGDGLDIPRYLKRA